MENIFIKVFELNCKSHVFERAKDLADCHVKTEVAHDCAVEVLFGNLIRVLNFFFYELANLYEFWPIEERQELKCAMSSIFF